MSEKKNIVMAFGTFDGFHEGHRYFLNEAKRLGDRLIVVVAHDSAVQELKKRMPRATAALRAAAIRETGLADEVVIGDEVQGSWNILKQYKPDIIALGHDQHGLRAALESIKGELDFKLASIGFLERNR